MLHQIHGGISPMIFESFPWLGKIVQKKGPGFIESWFLPARVKSVSDVCDQYTNIAESENITNLQTHPMTVNREKRENSITVSWLSDLLRPGYQFFNIAEMPVSWQKACKEGRLVFVEIPSDIE